MLLCVAHPATITVANSTAKIERFRPVIESILLVESLVATSVPASSRHPTRRSTTVTNRNAYSNPTVDYGSSTGIPTQGHHGQEAHSGVRDLKKILVTLAR